jgi:hypothetical protein
MKNEFKSRFYLLTAAAAAKFLHRIYYDGRRKNEINLPFLKK